MKTRHHRRASVVLSILAVSAATATASLGAGLHAADVTTGIVISQVYGGGGFAGSTLNADYVELFNRGTTPQTMSGWALVYTSPSGAAAPASALKTATLQPGEYYLVAMGTGTTGAALPAADDTGILQMGNQDGQVQLVNASNAVVDNVAYGEDFASSGDGPTGTLSNTTAAVRKGDGADDGCTDADSNVYDFDVVTVTATTPRNSATPHRVCASQATGGKGLVISQVFAAGGGKYNHDFVELFNPTAAPVPLDGVSLQYASATGNFGATANNGTVNVVVLPVGTSVLSGAYFLVQLASGGTSGSTNPVPDLTGNVDLDTTAGKLALVNGDGSLGCGAAAQLCPATDFVDLVGWGATATQFAGSGPVPSLGAESAFRDGGGCVDTGDNAKDFVLADAKPRHRASAENHCQVATPDAGSDSGAPEGGAGAGDGGTGSRDSGPGDMADSGGSALDGGDSGGGSTTDGGLVASHDASAGGNGGTGEADATASGNGDGGGEETDEASSGGCSTTGTTRPGDGAISFSMFAFVVLASGARRRKRS